MPSDRLKLETVLQQLQADYTKLGTRIEELSALVREEQTPNQKAKRLLDSFCSKWAAVKGRKYVPNGAKDIGICKRLVLAELPDVLERLDRFLASKDAFVVGAGHSLPAFAATVNNYGLQEHLVQIIPSIREVCERAQLTQAEMSWFEGAHLRRWQGQDALPEILMPNRDSLAWAQKFYGARLAPYAVLKLQEGA